MPDMLTELRSTRLTTEPDDDTFVIRVSTPQAAVIPQREAAQVIEDLPRQPPNNQISNGNGLLQLLRQQPDVEELIPALKAVSITSAKDQLNLQVPGPLQAQIINTLVSTTIPDFWSTLDSDARFVLVHSLTSVAGINAILAALKRSTEPLGGQAYAGNKVRRSMELLEVLQDVLRPKNTVVRLWSSLTSLQEEPSKHALAWKEAIQVLTSGRIVSIQAAAFDLIKDHELASQLRPESGSTFATWLAGGMLDLALNDDLPSLEKRFQGAAQLLVKSLSLGYSQIIVSTVILGCLGCDDHRRKAHALTSLFRYLPTSGRRRLLDAVLLWLSNLFSVSGPADQAADLTSRTVSAVASLLQILIEDNSASLKYLETIVFEPASSMTISLPVKQAIITVLIKEQACDLSALLERQMLRFGDQLFIDHASIAQQESLAQTLLMSAGSLHRKQPHAVRMAIRGGHHLQGVSNRLGCSSSRARWLGMIVATALSRLVDQHGSQMNFDTSDMQSPEAKAWFDLVDIQASIRTLKDLSTAISSAMASKEKRRPKPSMLIPTIELPLINGKQTFGPPRPPALAQTEIEGERLIELEDDTPQESYGLKPYAKPDSDPEDSDEDATLVNRKKIKPPVYIRTLMSMLRDTESAERFQMALRHAAPLVRRKTGYGHEVDDHAEELARILSNLQDPFETEEFDELRLQALVAIVLSNVAEVAPWVARQAFIRDYSISQRCILLTALGLSGRELANLDDRLNPSIKGTAFPSKQLPARLDAIYGTSRNATATIDAAGREVEQSMIQPMALAAADQTTSYLDAIKIRKFSDRSHAQRNRHKPHQNALAKLFGAAYFFPLLAAFQREAAAFGDSSTFLSTPIVLTTFLKTVAILLHASGPATLDLRQITIELWEVLLVLRVRAVSDITIMEAVLFSLLTMLETNANMHDIATNSPKQLMETKEWAELVFERTGGGNLIGEEQGEEARVRTLCAGVLTKTNEIITVYQDALMGGWTGI